MTQRPPRHHQRDAVIALLAGVLIAVSAGWIGCSDPPPVSNDGPGEDGCAADEVWDPVQEVCVEGGGGEGGGGEGGGGEGGGGEGGGGEGGGGEGGGGEGGNNNANNTTPCTGLQCDQVACPPGEGTTSLSGRVTIPSGELPLPNVTVYVPNAPLDPIPDGASCERCEDMLSGNPLVQTITDMRGDFRLDNVPVADEVPLVMQTGKWRRKVYISNVQECTDNEITDPDKTRLPRNQTEGNIPRIAVTTGGWDALECLIYQIGVDDREFTTANDDSGRVTLFTGISAPPPLGYGAQPTSEFSAGFNDGESFTRADQWWDQASNLKEYDIVMHSCSDPHASQQARQALQEFADVGGRAFMTDLHREWLEDGTSDFQSVANWQPQDTQVPQVKASIDINAPGGGLLFDWMDHLGRLDIANQFDAYEIWNNISSVDQNLAERWIYSGSGGNEQDLYIAFNTPVAAAEEQQCGRVVYSDLHVAAGTDTNPGWPFPQSCSSGSMSSQEMVLVYMFFDLAACIDPDCIPISCSDVPGNCEVHDNGCGGTIDCGECCVDKGEDCTTDSDCCDTLWCHENGTCTDACRAPHDECTDSSQCCVGSCDTERNECVGG